MNGLLNAFVVDGVNYTKVTIISVCVCMYVCMYVCVCACVRVGKQCKY